MPCGLNCQDCSDPSPSIPADYSVPGYGIQRNCRRAQWALVVRTAEAQTDWVVCRRRRNPFDAVKLPTAVRIKGEIFQLQRAEQTSAGWTYRFGSWPPNDPVGQVVDLTAEAVGAAKAEKAYLERSNRLTPWAPFYEFLFGFLPTRTQVRLSERFFFDAGSATRKCALLQCVVCFFLAIGTASGLVTQASWGRVVLSGSLFLLAMEGGLRWAHAVVSGEPFGLLPLELLSRLWSRGDDPANREG